MIIVCHLTTLVLVIKHKDIVFGQVGNRKSRCLSAGHQEVISVNDSFKSRIDLFYQDLFGGNTIHFAKLQLFS